MARFSTSGKILNCQSENVAYLIWCEECKLQGAGRTLKMNTKLESLRFPQRGPQREHHYSFLCFPSKKLTVKIYRKRLWSIYEVTNSRNL